jgi:SAM-dependent methyltransferase
MTSAWLDDVRDSYDTVVDGYVAMFPDGLANHPLVRGALAMFAELVGDADGPVLDAGCGIGLLTGPMREKGLDVFGVDISPGMLAVARRNHPGVRFEEGSLTDLDVPALRVVPRAPRKAQRQKHRAQAKAA